jgi:hypothetical protein
VQLIRQQRRRFGETSWCAARRSRTSVAVVVFGHLPLPTVLSSFSCERRRRVWTAWFVWRVLRWSTVCSDVVPVVFVFRLRRQSSTGRFRWCPSTSVGSFCWCSFQGRASAFVWTVRSTTPNTVIEIGTSTWSASKRPGVRPRRASSESRSCCLHVGNYAGFRVSRHSSFSVFSCGVTEIVVFHHGVVTS